MDKIMMIIFIVSITVVIAIHLYLSTVKPEFMNKCIGDGGKTQFDCEQLWLDRASN